MRAAYLMLAGFLCRSVANGQPVPRWSAVPGVVGSSRCMIQDSAGEPHGPFYLGNIGVIGAPPSGMAVQYRGTWSTLGGPLGGGLPLEIRDAVFWSADPGSAPADLHISGHFDTAGGVPVANIARWDGRQWAPLGAGSPRSLRSLAVYDDDHEGPGGPLLYRGTSSSAGQPTDIALLRWDGRAWAPMPVALAPYPPTSDAQVLAMCVFDDDRAGPRPEGLYIGGGLGGGGSVVCYNIIRWDGQAYEALGFGTNSTVECMAVYDDDDSGSRPPALFVGGSFSSPVRQLARWDGQAWSSVVEIPSGSVEAMIVFDDDGSGPRTPGLFVTGSFGFPGMKVFKYRGWLQGYDSLNGGLTGAVGGSVGYALGVYDEDGPGPNPGGLYVGGDFEFAGGVPASDFARWGYPLPPGGPCYPDCNQDGALTLSDFACFMTRFAAADPYADCNQDGQRNLSDFGCFQTKFALGCP
ncbi:MAG: hypothetical protein IT437_03740 [Phycisphaerales bacterium]|nr:hypothetical protein [Phycisphaerales bacterium]